MPGLLLVGDAAGAVNPFNGEGIAYAIETGQIAAELVHEALVNDRPALTMQYPQVLRDTYGRYFVDRAAVRQGDRQAGDHGARDAATCCRTARSWRFALRAMANLTRRTRRRPAGSACSIWRSGWRKAA